MGLQIKSVSESAKRSRIKTVLFISTIFTSFLVGHMIPLFGISLSSLFTAAFLPYLGNKRAAAIFLIITGVIMLEQSCSGLLYVLSYAQTFGFGVSPQHFFLIYLYNLFVILFVRVFVFFSILSAYKKVHIWSRLQL